MTIVKAMIGKDGQIQIEFEGFQGKSCYAEAEKLLQRLAANGIKTTILNIQDKDGAPVFEYGNIKA
jgi:hypothetical protein